MRVLFWGTPEFATPALRALVGEGFDVVGVVTQPDRAVGRSRSVLQWLDLQGHVGANWCCHGHFDVYRRKGESFRLGLHREFTGRNKMEDVFAV